MLRSMSPDSVSAGTPKRKQAGPDLPEHDQVLDNVEHPKFGLPPDLTPTSVTVAVFILCLAKAAYVATLLSAFEDPNATFDPYVHVTMELIQVALKIWIYFLHHQARASLASVLLMCVALFPLVFAIAIRALLLILSEAQHSASGMQVMDAMPEGITVVPITIVSYPSEFPHFAQIHSYSKLLLAIFACVRQVRHPFASRGITSTHRGLLAVLGVLFGTTILVEKNLHGANATLGVISALVGIVLLLWDPAILMLDRWAIQLRHWKSDRQRQPVVIFFGAALTSSGLFLIFAKIVPYVAEFQLDTNGNN